MLQDVVGTGTQVGFQYPNIPWQGRGGRERTFHYPDMTGRFKRGSKDCHVADAPGARTKDRERVRVPALGYTIKDKG